MRKINRRLNRLLESLLLRIDIEGLQMTRDRRLRKRVSVNVKEFSSKFRSKYEIYTFLTVECRYFLPTYDQTSIWWLRSIALGERKGKF